MHLLVDNTGGAALFRGARGRDLRGRLSRMAAGLPCEFAAGCRVRLGMFSQHIEGLFICITRIILYAYRRGECFQDYSLLLYLLPNLDDERGLGTVWEPYRMTCRTTCASSWLMHEKRPAGCGVTNKADVLRDINSTTTGLRAHLLPPLRCALAVLCLYGKQRVAR